jgi:cysteine desulfurase
MVSKENFSAISKVYLDHHTATRPLSPSIEAMLAFFHQHWGSTTAPHQMGQELLPFLGRSSETILEMLGAKTEDGFYFFSSSSEAIGHLYQVHYFDYIRLTGKNHIVTTNIEETAVLMSLKRLEDLGCGGKILQVNAQGQLTKKILDEALRPRTSLVSISWANGLTGVIHPIADLAELCRAKDVRLHVDASYVIGKIYFRFADLDIDFLTFEGSLLHAPKSTAGMIVKGKTDFSHPISSLIGIPVGSVMALTQALEEVGERLDHLCLETARLRDKLETGIQEGFPEAVALFQKAERLPNCFAIAFPGVASDALLFLLNRRGVFASFGGGHCQKLSHILVACGIDETLAQCALSFSLSFETTEEEIDYAIKVIVECAIQLQKLSCQLR